MLIDKLINPIYQAFGIGGVIILVLAYFAFRNLLPTRQTNVNEGQCKRNMTELEARVKENEKTIETLEKEVKENKAEVTESLHKGDLHFLGIKKDLTYIMKAIDKQNGGTRHD